MSAYLCDACRNGSWRGGEFRCAAPGAGGVTAKSRAKRLDWADPRETCRHYKAKEVGR